MQTSSGFPSLNCGKVFKVKLPNELDDYHPPINLAAVKVNTRNIKNPCVLFNYSQNLMFDVFNSNPILSIVYRLVRRSNYSGKVSVLEEWNYRVSEVIPTIVEEEIRTIEPLVVNFCDCLEGHDDESFIYILQIKEIISNNTTFSISNQQISAIVSCGEAE